MKGDLEKAISLLRTAAEKYQELISELDAKDDDNWDLIQSLSLIKGQAEKRVGELEILLQSKHNQSHPDAGTNTNQDNLKSQLIRLVQQMGLDDKLNSQLLDYRQKLSILKINGNNIDLVTSPEQKLKYENDLLNKMQLVYDAKLGKYDKFYEHLILLLNNTDPNLSVQLSLMNMNREITPDNEFNDNENSERLQQVTSLRAENNKLRDEVQRLNDRWDELVQSARKRKERESSNA